MTGFSPSNAVVKNLVHGAGGLRAACLAARLGARHGYMTVEPHRLGHHRAGGDADAMADLDITEDFCAGADHDAVADFGMAVFPFLAGAAQGHVVQYGDIITDLGGLADHEAGGVIEENAAADLCRRMDVAL